MSWPMQRTEVDAGPRLGRAFYERSVHEVARDLIGCVVAPRRDGGTRGGDRELSRGGARLTRLRRITARSRTLFGPPGTRLRVLLLRRPLAPERGRRAGGRGGGGADQGARAARGHRPDARAPRRRARRVALLGTREAHPGPRHRPGARTRARCSTAPWRSSPGRQPTREPRIVTGERIGITKAADLPWRFCDADSRHVSRPLPAAMTV